MKYSVPFVLMLACIFSIAETKAMYTEKNAGDPVAKVVRSIARAGIYESTAYAASHEATNKQTQNKVDLIKMASVEKLTELVTRHKKAIVRLYAFEALVQKQKIIPKEIIDRMINDNEMVTIFDGKTSTKKPVNSIAAGFLY